MQKNLKKSVRVLNVVVSVVFVLLLAAHWYMLEHMQEWYKHYETFWPEVDSLLVRPLLGFTTGYALFSALFSLLHAKLEIEGLKRRNILRVVMSVITLVFVAALVCVFLGIMGFEFPPFLGKFVVGICREEWLWLILGVYWFLSLNALRYDELRPLDDDDDFDEEDDI